MSILKKIRQKQYRLKSFVCIAVLIASYISFNATYLVVSSIYRHAFIKNADEVSDAISHQIFNSMLQLMERGWSRDELKTFLDSIKGVRTQFPYKIDMFRGESVERDYGKIEQSEIGKNIRDAFSSGDAITYKDNSNVINIYPIKADVKCLKCHVHARVGEVLGVIKVQQDISPAINEAKKRFNAFFFILFTIPFIMAGAVALFLNKRIKSSTDFFHKQVSEINSIKDLTKLNNLDIVETGFKEFNETLSEVRELSRKIRSLAVDRDILEFEIKVLEKFVITSEVVRDWKEYVGYLLKDLFIFADNMMYKAKAEGKNRIVIPTQKDIIDVFKTLSEKTFIVSNAIEEKKITPYFQPIINIKTGEIDCCEVFGRMGTDKGILNAREFIEVAKRLGAIGKLDLILMEKVFEKVKVEGYKGYLFINLSTKSLILSEFIPNILKLAKQYDIDNSKVIFEITERDTVKNISLLEKFVDNLKFEGFGFSIDDFGSGLSSFHYVKMFPIDFVKIDGDFIRSMVRSEKDMAIVKTMLVLAKEFNIKTVAEYVENKDILDAIKALGIDYGQGYYIGTPSPDLVTGI